MKTLYTIIICLLTGMGILQAQQDSIVPPNRNNKTNTIHIIDTLSARIGENDTTVLDVRFAEAIPKSREGDKLEQQSNSMKSPASSSPRTSIAPTESYATSGGFQNNV